MVDRRPNGTIEYRNPRTLPPQERLAYHLIAEVFGKLVEMGWTPMGVNAFMVGMCHSSMDDLLGKEDAIKVDREWRESIGWRVKP